MANSAHGISGTQHGGGAAAYDQRATMRAWEDLLSGDDRPVTAEGGVRPEILESWSRSLSRGIDALAELAPLDNREDAVLELRRTNRELCEAARDTLAQIGRLLEGAEAILLLCDQGGRVIEAIGDGKTLDDGREIHLEVGGVWDEGAIGTNGIGTAIRSNRPVIVHASEHYCVGIKSWTCAAAPIRDPFDLRVLGAIDLSGPPEIFRPHNIALVAAAAREIEITLADRQRQEQSRLLEAFIDLTPARNMDDGVVILDRFGRVVFSRNTLRADRPGRPGSELQIGRTLIELSDTMTDADISAALPSHIRPSGINRLILDGELRGAALLLPAQRRPAPQGLVRIPPRPGTNEEPLRIIGESPAFREAIELTRRAASAGASVLIQGETGVGKELFARLVHHGSGRGPGAPFVTVNCGAVSSELVGSELFGHVAGAFTGAMRDGKAGKFEQADGGVLCLDEIGEMPLDIQPYLLRVLEQRAVYRIGDSKRRPVDVQVVAMTNRALGDDVKAGTFRRDLYYRISTLTVEVPPLRRRKGDVPLLVEHFNRCVADRRARRPLVVPDAVMDLLDRYDWPGNVRELRNLFERLHVVVTGSAVRPDDLPAEIRAPRPAAPGIEPAPRAADDDQVSLLDVEERAIRRAFAAEAGNVTRVAAALGISRPTLYRKMKQYGIRRVYE